MAKKFYTPIDLDQNQVLNIVIHKGGAFPSNPVDGQWFYRSDTKIVYYYDGTTWVPLAAGGGTEIESIIAGEGLSGGGNNGAVTLDVNVDNATLEISSDIVRIKDAGVTTAKLATDSVTTIKLVDKNVTFSKIQDVATMRVLGRVTAGSGSVGEIAILDEDDMISNSDTSLATQQSIRAYVDNRIASIGVLIGGFDANANTTFPTPAGTSKGDYWYVTVAGTVQGVDLNVGDVLIANVDNPSPTNVANWVVIETNRGQATTTILGLVMLADGADVIAGTNNTKAITPAALVQRTATETRTGLIEIATQAEVDAGVDDERAITPAKLVSYVNIRTGSHHALIGNGVALTYVLTHNLGTQSLLVQLNEAATGNFIEADIQATDANNVTVGFSKAPATNSIRVTIHKLA